MPSRQKITLGNAEPSEVHAEGTPGRQKFTALF
jgi:hypothetical protein